MKTIFSFTESLSKQKVILKHSKDVKIYKETRKDHIEWKDAEGNHLINRRYIVIRYPKTKVLDWSQWKTDNDDRYDLGFLMNHVGEEIELLLYDRFTFTWRLYELERVGLFRVSQRVIPDWKEWGELFPCYINSRGIKEWTYNIIFGMIQLPFVLYKDYMDRKREVKEI